MHRTTLQKVWEEQMNKKISRGLWGVTVLGLALSSMGCQGFQSPDTFNSIQSVSAGSITAANIPACEINYADYQLDEQIVDFEVTSTTNVNAGFNLITGILQAIGLSVQASKAQMEVSMHLYPTNDPTSSLADATGTATATNTSFNFSIDIYDIGAGVGNSTTTPVTTLTSNTINSGLANVATALTKDALAWSSRVVDLLPTQNQFIVPAGSIAGLRLGDSFNVYNIDYIWQGDPCNSTLLFQDKTTTTPIATAQVVQIQPNAALLQVTDMNGSAAIQLGAQVFIQNLPLASGEKSRTLLHSVIIGNTQSQPLQFTTGQTLNLSNYLAQLTPPLLPAHGLYPRNAEVNGGSSAPVPSASPTPTPTPSVATQ
jgi:hypothetical protein